MMVVQLPAKVQIYVTMTEMETPDKSRTTLLRFLRRMKKLTAELVWAKRA